MKTLFPRFAAGFLAISLNTLLLKVAKPLHIKAESGGLLKLVLQFFPQSIRKIKLLHTECFWYIFHYLTGALMVVFFFVFFEQLRLRPIGKGLVFSLFPWLINGLVVLLLLGQGVLGLHTLSTSGILYYFMANLAFGIVLALSINRFQSADNRKEVQPD
jgi:hypothetical protein